MTLPDWNPRRWLLVFAAAGAIALGVWAFGVDKPARVVQVQIALRNAGDQRAELAVLETDHQGVRHFYVAQNFPLDYGLRDRPRSLYSEPIALSNDDSNAPSKVRITQRGLSDDEVRLGFRTLRPNRRWGSTRFPSRDPVTLEQIRSQDWTYSPPLDLRIVYHQPIVDAVRVLIYVVGTFALIVAIALIIWRRWLS